MLWGGNSTPSGAQSQLPLPRWGLSPYLWVSGHMGTKQPYPVARWALRCVPWLSRVQRGRDGQQEGPQWALEKDGKQDAPTPALWFSDPCVLSTGDAAAEASGSEHTTWKMASQPGGRGLFPNGPLRCAGGRTSSAGSRRGWDVQDAEVGL